MTDEEKKELQEKPSAPQNAKQSFIDKEVADTINPYEEYRKLYGVGEDKHLSEAQLLEFLKRLAFKLAVMSEHTIYVFGKGQI